MLSIKEKNSFLRGALVISILISLLIISMALTSYFRYGIELPTEFYLPLCTPFALLLMNIINSKLKHAYK